MGVNKIPFEMVKSSSQSAFASNPCDWKLAGRMIEYGASGPLPSNVSP